MLATAEVRTVRGSLQLRIISPAGFLATKLVAFSDRGEGDYLLSEDIENLLTVIDGRAGIVAEVAAAPAKLRRYVRDSIRHLNGSDDFRDAAPGALASDAASQARLPALLRKLRALADLPD